MLKSLKETLVERDGISSEEAEELIQECKNELNQRLEEGEMPFDICKEYFGLEPDYIFDLL